MEEIYQVFKCDDDPQSPLFQITVEKIITEAEFQRNHLNFFSDEQFFLEPGVTQTKYHE